MLKRRRDLRKMAERDRQDTESHHEQNLCNDYREKRVYTDNKTPSQLNYKPNKRKIKYKHNNKKKKHKNSQI